MSDPALNQTVSKQAGLAFYDHAMNLLRKLKNTQSEVIQKAAELRNASPAEGSFSFWQRSLTHDVREGMSASPGSFPGFVALVETALFKPCGNYRSEWPALLALSRKL